MIYFPSVTSSEKAPEPSDSCCPYRTFIRYRAFTLVELIAAIAIIGILATILISTISHVRNSANNTTCVSNLRQLFNAAKLWSNDNYGRMPDSRWWQEPASNEFASSWSIAPYLDMSDSMESDEHTIYTCPVAQALSPSKRTFSRTYSMNQYAGYTFNGLNQNLDDPVYLSQLAIFMDGVIGSSDGEYYSFATEAHMASGAKPSEQFPHDGNMNAVFADGHVSSITRKYAHKHLSENRIRVPFWGGIEPSDTTE